jgi:hypothetical protein
MCANTRLILVGFILVGFILVGFILVGLIEAGFHYYPFPFYYWLSFTVNVICSEYIVKPAVLIPAT